MTTPEKDRVEIPQAVISEHYFASRGTVVSWWDPLGNEDPAFKRYLIDQTDDLLKRCPVVGKRVLDCCTGRGRMAIAAAEAGAASVTGVDISEDMLAMARSNAFNVGVAADFRRGSVTDLHIPNETVDVVFCLEALLHLDDPWRTVAEFRRVLSRGGCAVITTNGANPLARLAQPPRRGAHPAGRLTRARYTMDELSVSLWQHQTHIHAGSGAAARGISDARPAERRRWARGAADGAGMLPAGGHRAGMLLRGQCCDEGGYCAEGAAAVADRVLVLRG